MVRIQRGTKVNDAIILILILEGVSVGAGALTICMEFSGGIFGTNGTVYFFR